MTKRSGNQQSKRQKLTAYLGHVITPVKKDAYLDFREGAVVVDEQGKIAAVGVWEKIRRGQNCLETIVDYGKRIILPGFVDLHVHLPQLPAAGLAGASLLDWLDKQIYPAEAKFSDAGYAGRIANWFFDELVKNGTTLASVYTTIHPDATDMAFKVAAARGLRLIMGKTMMDENCPPGLKEDSALAVKQSEELCKRWNGYDNGRIRYAFTPRFAVTSSQSLLEMTGKLADRYQDAYIQTHLAENPEEVIEVHRRFPWAISYLDVYKNFELVNSRSIFAHAIHLGREDMSELNRSGAAIAHCPSSNFFLKSGVFPYEEMEVADVGFGLASDVGGGPELSMFKVMRDAAFMQLDRWLSPAELLWRATLAGAEAINQDYLTGSLVPGKEADFVVIDPSVKSSIPHNMLDDVTDNILSSLIYQGDDRMIAATFVRGRKLYQSELSREVKTETVEPVVVPPLKVRLANSQRIR